MKKFIFAVLGALTIAACGDNGTAVHNDCYVNPKTHKPVVPCQFD